MFSFDSVEPTDHLYQEGNIIGKRNHKQGKSKKDKNHKDQQKSNKEKRHKYQTGDLGNLIDIEV